jgi:hypothetical protein
MIKLGTLFPVLQRLADEMAADDAPPDLGSLSPASLRAELEARGIEPTTDLDRERERRRCRRRVRHFERRRENRK